MKDSDVLSISRRFSAAADYYEPLATAQRQAAEELLMLLPSSAAPVGRILEIGCGTGIMTRLLVKRYPDANITALDISPQMIDKARRQALPRERITWLVADASSFESSRLYDLIVSNCALHWLRDPAAALRRLSKTLQPEGALCFAIMLDGTLAELHACRKNVAPHKPPLQSLPSAGHVLDWIRHAELRLTESRINKYRGEYRSAAAFLEAIHDQGLTGGPFSRSLSPLTRGELARLMNRYGNCFSTPQGNVYATYRVLFVRAVAASTLGAAP